jgi:selenocysteine lyase/cysteine desulfurase
MTDRRDFLGMLGAFGLLGGRGARGPLALSPKTDSDFLFDPGLVYLQTGSLGPTPRPVMDRVIEVWRTLEGNPVAQGYGALEQAQDAVRGTAAAFLGCTRDEIVLTSSTTEGMNWVAEGLRLKPGDRILTTDQEHPGGRSCWDHLARTGGIVIDEVKIPTDLHDAAAIVDRFSQAIRPATRVLSFSHLLTSTGLRMPVAPLAQLARDRSAISVVDGAQAAGGVVVDVKALGADVYVTSGHKWLLAPKGTGILYMSEGLGTRIQPIALEGGRASYSGSSGVRNIPGLIGLGLSLQYLAERRPAATEAHNLELRNLVQTSLADLPRLQLVSAPAGPMASPLITYRLPASIAAGELYQRLFERHNVVVKVVPGQWLNGHRISTHLFNTRADVLALRAALGRELG